MCKSESNRLGAKNGVKEILSHPWFGKIDRLAFLKKKVIPPISFQTIEDLSFNEAEMKKSNSEYVNTMLR